MREDILPYLLLHSMAMRCESHFNPSFGNVKAFNLKKLKLSLSPSPQWPQAALRRGWGATAGKFLRQTKACGRTVFWKGILRIHSRNLY